MNKPIPPIALDVPSVGFSGSVGCVGDGVVVLQLQLQFSLCLQLLLHEQFSLRAHPASVELQPQSQLQFELVCPDGPGSFPPIMENPPRNIPS